MVIDCELLFDAIRAKKNLYWVAGMILVLDINQDSKYKLGKLLLRNDGVFNWFLMRLYGGNNAS